jgi:hypothetical protein
MLLSRQLQGVFKGDFALRELVLRLQNEAAMQFHAPRPLARRFDALQSFAKRSQPFLHRTRSAGLPGDNGTQLG